MRRLEVIHETRYQYGAAVEHAHHWVRLRPIEDAGQRLLSFALAIDPTPRHRTERRDALGVAEVRFEIDAPHDELTVTSHSLVERAPSCGVPTGPDEPWEATAARLSFEAGRPWEPTAADACAAPLAFPHPELRAWAAESFVPGRPLREATVDLMHRAHREIRYDPAATHVGTTGLEALRLRRGVCQDLAHVMIGALRSLGLAARYVSGYLLTMPPPGRPRLIGADASHAWVAVWCPLAGWFELDPTNDRTPGDDYVVLARGRDYTDVAPVRGVIRGGGSHVVTVGVTVRDPSEAEPVGAGASPVESPAQPPIQSSAQAARP